jgi:hypothetical protein
MAKSPAEKQLNLYDLFDIPAVEKLNAGSQDFSLEVRNLLSDILKKSPLSRYEISGRLSEQIGREITKWMLDSWTGESRENHFPFAYAVAFESVCDTRRLVDFLARKRGCRLLIGEEVLDAEIGKLRRQRQEIDTKIKLLENYRKGRP